MYLRTVMQQLEEGGLPKQTVKTALKEVRVAVKDGVSPLKILGAVKKNVPEELLAGHFAESAAHTAGPREVILSEYFVEGK